MKDLAITYGLTTTSLRKRLRRRNLIEVKRRPTRIKLKFSRKQYEEIADDVSNRRKTFEQISKEIGLDAGTLRYHLAVLGISAKKKTVLSKRELIVYNLHLQGKNNAQIGIIIQLTKECVSVHLSNARKKLRLSGQLKPLAHQPEAI